MAITDWPVNERPREKLLKQGAQSLSDAELLAIFLRTGIPGKTAVDLARDLLTRFEHLNGLLSASQTAFCSAPGLGSAKYAQLQAILEMARRYLFEEVERSDYLSNPDSVERFLRAKIGRLPYEVFCCIFLDNQHRVLRIEELFRGTIDSASVYPREVVSRALYHNAAAVIFAHNHPSGLVEASQADKDVTQKLKQTLALIDVRVLDHIITGPTNTLSFAKKGLL